MSRTCASPIAWERLVDYWAGDLEAAETERVEGHLFACDECSADSARVAQVAHAFRSAIPVVVTAAQTAELRARGLAVEEKRFEPGKRTEVSFGASVDVLILRLAGMDLSRAERVHVGVRVESTGDALTDEHFAPFDRERGEVLVACQRHFAMYPTDIAFVVRVHERDGRTSSATYIVPHAYGI